MQQLIPKCVIIYYTDVTLFHDAELQLECHHIKTITNKMSRTKQELVGPRHMEDVDNWIKKENIIICPVTQGGTTFSQCTKVNLYYFSKFFVQQKHRQILG